MLLENALLAALNPPHASRISELDTELSAYASGLGDLESINDFAEDSSRETGGRSPVQLTNRKALELSISIQDCFYFKSPTDLAL